MHTSPYGMEKKNKFLDKSDSLGLSKMAYNFLGGVIKNASSLSAFFNPTINSYRRINAPPTKSGASWSPSSISYTGNCLLYTSPSPRDQRGSRMPSSA